MDSNDIDLSLKELSSPVFPPPVSGLSSPIHYHNSESSSLSSGSSDSSYWFFLDFVPISKVHIVLRMMLR